MEKQRDISQKTVYKNPEKSSKKKSGKKVKPGKSDRIFHIVNISLLVVFLAAELYPIIYMLSCSFSSGEALVNGKVRLFPVDFSLAGYETVFLYKPFWTGLKNSVVYTFSATIVSLVLTLLAAYPLSRKDLKGKKFIMILFLITMLFNGGLIPTYLLIRNLHMLNTIWAIILPSAVTAYNVIVARTFFVQNIPQELLESAQMDGCSDFTFFRKIVIPLSMPIVAVITLYIMVAQWNGYFAPMIYLSGEETATLQLVLRRVLLLASRIEITDVADVSKWQESKYMSETLKYGMIIISSLPLMIVYPFVQKNFVKGVMVGSIKG